MLRCFSVSSLVINENRSWFWPGERPRQQKIADESLKVDKSIDRKTYMSRSARSSARLPICVATDRRVFKLVAALAVAIFAGTVLPLTTSALADVTANPNGVAMSSHDSAESALTEPDSTPPTHNSPVTSATNPTPTPSVEELTARSDQLWAAKPPTNDTLNVVVIDANGRPTIMTVEGANSADAVRSVVTNHADASVNWAVPVGALANDPLRSMQWGLDSTQAEVAWTATNGSTGTGVTVAVVDTGVAAHPDLDANIVAGYDFVDGDTTPVDGFGHGTHVSGIIAAVANNASGIAGAAPGVHIMPVRVLDNTGAGWDSNVAAGIVWAVDNGAQVVNLSLGGAYSAATAAAVAYAASHNVVVVAAAGNGGIGGSESWPGADPHALGVGSIDSTGLPSSFSTRGAYVDVAAPGGSITSTYLNGGYATMSGTSMAAPFAAASAAIVRHAHPLWTEAQIRTALIMSAIDTAPAGRDTATGAGEVSVVAALALTAPWDAAPPASVTATVAGTNLEIDASPVTSPGVSGYQFERDGIVVASGLASSFTDPNRATVAGTSTYTVRAIGPSGELAQAQSVTTTMTPPLAPTIAVTASGVSVTLTVSNSTSNTWLTYRNGIAVAPTSSTATVISLGNEPTGTNTYTVRAVTTAGTSQLSAPATITVTLPPLTAPTTLTAAISGVDILVKSGLVANASQYRFDRNGVTVATLTTNSFVDTERASIPGTVTYSVRALGTNNRVGPAKSVSITVTPPAPPTITGSAIGPVVTLSLSGATATTWWVYRDGAKLSTAAGTATSITLSAQPTGVHGYTVRGITSTGSSLNSANAAIDVPLVAPTAVTVKVVEQSLTVTATSVANAAAYRFTRNGVWVADQLLPVLVDAEIATQTGSYTYTVAPIDGLGLVGASRASAAFAVLAPAAPVLSSAVISGTAVLVTLTGSATTWYVYVNGVNVAAVAGSIKAFAVYGITSGSPSITVRGSTTKGTSAASNALIVTIP